MYNNCWVCQWWFQAFWLVFICDRSLSTWILSLKSLESTINIWIYTDLGCCKVIRIAFTQATSSFGFHFLKSKYKCRWGWSAHVDIDMLVYAWFSIMPARWRCLVHFLAIICPFSRLNCQIISKSDIFYISYMWVDNRWNCKITSFDDKFFKINVIFESKMLRISLFWEYQLFLPISVLRLRFKSVVKSLQALANGPTVRLPLWIVIQVICGKVLLSLFCWCWRCYLQI